jgi:uncharacterized protein YkwD
MKLLRRSAAVLALILVALGASWFPWRDPVTNSTKGQAAPVTVDASSEPAPVVIPPARTAPRADRATRPVPAMSRADQAAAAELLRLVNAERQRGRCKPVSGDARLASAALAHSVDMAQRRYFSHNTAEGLDPWQRARDAGYQRPTGENIAMGYRDAKAVLVGWMASPGHRANILNCTATAMGVGIARNGDGTLYWTQLFGAP